MKKFIAAFLLSLSCFFQPDLVHAANCSSAANAMVAGRPNASVLAVQTTRNANGGTTCIIRILINKNDGSPGRVVTRRVRL